MATIRNKKSVRDALAIEAQRFDSVLQELKSYGAIKGDETIEGIKSYVHKYMQAYVAVRQGSPLIQNLTGYNNHVADLVPWVPAEVEEYGLSTAQFRVLCHIARLGGCWDSRGQIQRNCRITRGTLAKVLNFLSEKQIIERKCRPGKPTVFRIRPRSTWLPNPSWR